MARRLRVLNTTRDHVLATNVQEPSNPWTRMIGLLGRARLPPDYGLHLRPCRVVHTWFMRFSIDVIYLDEDDRVVKAVPGLRPFRFSAGGRHAHATLELPAGTIAMTGTRMGDLVRLDVVDDTGHGV
jgi:uncharacterized protein